MKFTCDSCGAQYQIADDKLGAKGVKVRCRKCQYLIIVRPKGYEPVAKTTIDPVMLAEHDSPRASELDQTSAESRSLSEAGSNDLAEPMSGDFGLSQEFKALGFDEDSGVKAPPKGSSFPAELDVNRVRENRGDSMSPFQGDSSGGSLDHLSDPPAPSSPSEDHTRRLGLSSPPATDEIGESTKVELQAEKKSAWSLELDSEDTLARDEPTNKGPSPVKSNGFGASSRHRGVSGLTSGEVEVGAMLKERNEFAEIRSTVDAEMAGLSSELDSWSKGKSGPPSSMLDDSEDTGEEDALDKLGAAPVRAAATPATTGESVLGTGIEHEIGDAFDAMFSPAQMASEELMRAGLSAKTEMSPRLPEEPAVGDKLPTKIFDTEAMANVAAEQERAISPRAKPVAEWYVAIDDAQVGPLTVDDVTSKWREGDVGPNSLCWKQGMADWTAIRFTDGLKQLAEKEVQEPKMAARVERRHAEEEEAMVARPPQISMAVEAEPMRASMASSPAKLGDAPAWRPSAASLLATLAAEELNETPAPIKDKRGDVALGPAIPATSNALEKLLESSTTGPIPSPFGQAEKSESAIRPLPRRPDTVSSIPLRDPTIDRPKTTNTPMLAAAIIGGCLLIAGALVVGPKLFADPPPVPPPTVIVQQPAPPPPAQVGGVPGNPTLAAGGVPGTPGSEVAAVVPGSVGGTPTPPPAVEPVKTEPPVVASADADRTEDKGKKAKASKRTEKTERTERVEKVAKEPEKKAEPPPTADPDDPDDLLPKQKKRLPTSDAVEASNTPKQLDDSDILGVLRKNREDVKGCLEKQAASDGNLDGTMTVKAVIEKSGKAGRVTIAPDKFKTSVVGKCVSSALQRWKFPEFSGPAIPIDFPVHVRGR